jgi:hypothetical protein
MTLEQIFYVSQLVAALGVVASLIFVGFQVRDNVRAVRSATAQAVHNSYSAWYLALAGNENALATSTKGMVDFESLTPTEKAQFVGTYMAFLSNGQNAFHQWHEGHLAHELWLCWEVLLMNLVNTPGGAAFWRERSYIFGPGFQAEVKKIMGRQPHPGAKAWGVVPLSVTHRESTSPSARLETK